MRVDGVGEDLSVQYDPAFIEKGEGIALDVEPLSKALEWRTMRATVVYTGIRSSAT